MYFSTAVVGALPLLTLAVGQDFYHESNRLMPRHDHKETESLSASGSQKEMSDHDRKHLREELHHDHYPQDLLEMLAQQAGPDAKLPTKKLDHKEKKKEAKKLYKMLGNSRESKSDAGQRKEGQAALKLLASSKHGRKQLHKLMGKHEKAELSDGESEADDSSDHPEEPDSPRSSSTGHSSGDFEDPEASDSFSRQPSVGSLGPPEELEQGPHELESSIEGMGSHDPTKSEGLSGLESLKSGGLPGGEEGEENLASGPGEESSHKLHRRDPFFGSGSGSGGYGAGGAYGMHDLAGGLLQSVMGKHSGGYGQGGDGESPDDGSRIEYPFYNRMHSSASKIYGDAAWYKGRASKVDYCNADGWQLKRCHNLIRHKRWAQESAIEYFVSRYGESRSVLKHELSKHSMKEHGFPKRLQMPVGMRLAHLMMKQRRIQD